MEKDPYHHPDDLPAPLRGDRLYRIPYGIGDIFWALRGIIEHEEYIYLPPVTDQYGHRYQPDAGIWNIEDSVALYNIGHHLEDPKPYDSSPPPHRLSHGRSA